MTVNTRDERLQMRVDARTKRQLEEASHQCGLSLSAFVIWSAKARAEDILADRAEIELSAAALAEFERALNAPATVNERLSTTLSRRPDFTWLD
jgi:uncharacterized protein (DUF1778 family)